MRILTIVALLLVVPLQVAAQPSSEPSLLAAALKMAAALAVVCGLLLLFYAASRRGFGVLPKKQSQLIQIVETRSLGGRKFLCVVRIRNEEMLLGFSPDRIENLGRLAPADDKFSASLQQAQEKQQ